MEIQQIETLILTIRGRRVILSVDLARTYGVATKVLNQAVKRNAARFPPDFSWQLNADEAAEVWRSRSQFVTLKRGHNIKHLPIVFTEHGALMAATVLNSPTAVQMSIFVVRAFLRLRSWAMDHASLMRRLVELERRVGAHDQDLRQILAAVRGLIEPPATTSGRPIGFRPKPSQK